MPLVSNERKCKPLWTDRSKLPSHAAGTDFVCVLPTSCIEYMHGTVSKAGTLSDVFAVSLKSTAKVPFINVLEANLGPTYYRGGFSRAHQISHTFPQE